MELQHEIFTENGKDIQVKAKAGVCNIIFARTVMGDGTYCDGEGSIVGFDLASKRDINKIVHKLF